MPARTKNTLSSAYSEPMISYSKNFEDVLLRRLFKADYKGFYLDVGAHHPVYDSVTKHFYDNGWRGINIEPLMSMYNLLEEERHADKNLNFAISKEPGHVKFYEYGFAKGRSTSQDSVYKRYLSQGESPSNIYEVESSPLNLLLKKEHSGDVDFVKIDVEGAEKIVLETFNFEKWLPKAFVVESTRPHSRVSTREEWQYILLKHDYVFAYFDGLNSYYVQRNDKESINKLSVPVNVFDMFLQYKYLRFMSEEEVTALGKSMPLFSNVTTEYLNSRNNT